DINDPVQTWGKDGIEAYFVIGELKGAGQTGKDCYSGALTMDSVTLSELQRDMIRDKILEYMGERGKKDYVFQTPDGATFSLNEVLVSLRERKDSE
ncbi:hypothetical protein ACFLZ6_02170, partial [Nanoarchaeota archaeon]